jgi:DNA/RNA endonuclease YhcR with UshA esterase domain
MKRFMLVLCALAASLPFAFAQESATVNQITKEKLDKEVVLEGTVESFRPSNRENAPNSFQLKDATGVIRVCVWPIVFDQVPNRQAMRPGIRVRLTGKVASFRSAMEVHVEDAAKLSVPGGATATAVPTPTAVVASVAATTTTKAAGPPAVLKISDVTLARQGESVIVQGVVRSVRKPTNDRAPFVMKIGDESGTVDAVFWTDLADQLPDNKKPVSGDSVRVSGVVGEHRGNLQVRLAGIDDIRTQRSDPALFTGAPASSQAPEPQAAPAAVRASLDRIAAANYGTRLEVEAEVVSVTPIRLGRKVALRDSSGDAIALIWDTADGLKPEIREVKTSSTVTLQGSVEQANDAKVLVVKRPAEVMAVRP